MRAIIKTFESGAGDCIFLVMKDEMDIDDFKTINDLYGHPIGDLALKSFSKALVRKFGTKAIIARTGGDEFSVVFKEKSYDAR